MYLFHLYRNFSIGVLRDFFIGGLFESYTLLIWPNELLKKEYCQHLKIFLKVLGFLQVDNIDNFTVICGHIAINESLVYTGDFFSECVDLRVK